MSYSWSIPILAIIITCGGCQSVNTYQREQALAIANPVEDRRVITDSSLARKARVVGIQETKNISGYLKIQCELQNTTRNHQSLYYSFEWFDSEGFLVKTPMSRWQTLNLSPRELKSVDATAPTKDAVDFIFKLKEY
ncbi:MAG TPA: YcfL family protein [Kiritimatiellia bacterium]|nr:YcfL family protein [Kiritimatiellia bacterium]